MVDLEDKHPKKIILKKNLTANYKKFQIKNARGNNGKKRINKNLNYEYG